MTLQYLLLTFKPEGVEIRALYRTEAGPNPGGTTARQREIRSRKDRPTRPWRASRDAWAW